MQITDVRVRKIEKEGKVKAIGLSNFPDELLQEAIDTMEIKPQVVQVEAHPYYPQTKLKEILSQTDMALMAWYPLGHGDKNLKSRCSRSLGKNTEKPTHRLSCAGIHNAATL